ncbi:MAG TPA: GDP-mannose 4,6-dehydratase [Anaerolineae bacterium]|nr:GDP-mannose 4,6-dehydratase [Anaerolineae bacterium]
MHIFITGGAGFIGCNSATYFLNKQNDVTIFDNLSRPGAQSNLDWLRQNHGDSFTFVHGDIRDSAAITAAITVAQPTAVIHLAGQVAVTTSVHDPRMDFDVNALGTFNVLEAVRTAAPQAVLLYASTNKVYGGMEDIVITEEPTRYTYRDYPQGISESYPLDFHSPYGCSKGAGDQYVLDYARIYGLKTVSLRQSCIYGQRQFGVEDQGWVAHFIIAAVCHRPFSIYGDGKQVRDLLHVTDLVRLYEKMILNGDKVAGQAFNVGGGADNTLSIWREFEPILSELAGRPIEVDYGDWRPGDQHVFIADITKAQNLLDWTPQMSPKAGITDLFHWVTTNKQLFQ